VKVHDSARKHGIDPQAAIHAAEHAVFVSDLNDDSPARQLRLGSTPPAASSRSWCFASTAATNWSSTP
jgi:hypothetical protein